MAASRKRPTHADRPTAGLPGRSLPGPAFLDPALGLPAPPFPVPGLEAHSYSSQSANGRHPEPSVGTRTRQRAWPGPGVHLRGLSTRSYSSLGALWGSLKVSRAGVVAVTRASSTHTPACVPGTLCLPGAPGLANVAFPAHTLTPRPSSGQVCTTAPLASTLRLGGPRGAPRPLKVPTAPCGKEGDPPPCRRAGEGTPRIGRQEPSFPVFAHGPHSQREGQCLSSLGTARRAPAPPSSRPRRWAEALSLRSQRHSGPCWGSQAKAGSGERLRSATEELLTSPVLTAWENVPSIPAAHRHLGYQVLALKDATASSAGNARVRGSEAASALETAAPGPRTEHETHTPQTLGAGLVTSSDEQIRRTNSYHHCPIIVAVKRLCPQRVDPHQ